jgi:Flp pilus assembly protein TadB
MEHDEFKSAWRAGSIQVEVDRAKAMEVANAKTVLPARYQQEYQWWTIAWLVTLPAALVAAVFVKWWAGLLVLLFVTPVLFRATNRRVKRFTIEFALENGDFYAYAVDHAIIKLRTKSTA